MPRPPNPLVREAPGIVCLVFFFLAIPPLLGKTLLKNLVERMGLVRFNIFIHLFLWFVLIPIKMGLLWTISLKYFVGIPEFFFNI